METEIKEIVVVAFKQSYLCVEKPCKDGSSDVYTVGDAKEKPTFRITANGKLLYGNLPLCGNSWFFRLTEENKKCRSK